PGGYAAENHQRAENRERAEDHERAGSVGPRQEYPARTDGPDALREGWGQEPERSMAPSRSRFSREIVSSGMPFGQTAVHSPMLVQLPKPSASCCATMPTTRCFRSGWPCG